MRKKTITDTGVNLTWQKKLKEEREESKIAAPEFYLT